MQSIDPAQAQRVWQRVQGSAAPADAIPQLLTLEAQARAVYASLAPQLPGQAKCPLARLREESQQFFCIFSGMARLCESAVAPAPAPSIRGNPGGLLRLAWDGRMQSLALLTPETFPPAVHAVLPGLRSRMERHCLGLLALMGAHS